MVKKINEEQFEQVKNDAVAVVDFSATWCGPCKMLAPVLEEVSEDFAGKVSFYNVDVDDCGDLAMEFGIMSVPALVVLKNGEKAAQSVGFQPKEKITEFVNAQL